MEKRPGQEPEGRRERRPAARHTPSDPDDFFGLDVDRMSPRAQLTTALAIIVPVALAGIFLFTFTQVWWIWFTFFWVAFPAFGLLVRGIAGLSEDRTEPSLSGNSKEKELLEALRRRGELTPAQAAMETSLTVADADRMLEELAAKGHLEVRVRGGGIFYSLWGIEDGAERRGLEGES